MAGDSSFCPVTKVRNLLNPYNCVYLYIYICIYPAAIRVNLNIYPLDTGSKLLVQRSYLQESHYGPFAYNFAIDSSIRRLRRMIGPWRVFPTARDRGVPGHRVLLGELPFTGFQSFLKAPFLSDRLVYWVTDTRASSPHSPHPTIR